jgi:sec-independent protein translocase protein TatC
MTRVTDVFDKLMAPTPPGAEDDLGPKMTLMEHLIELRSRMIKMALALVITTALSFAFTDYLINILTEPLPGGRETMQAIDVTENIGVWMRVSLISGVVLAMPVLVYQGLGFIVPGLTRAERRYLWLVVPGASVLFLIGVLFCYFIMLPVAVPFLLTFLNIPTKPRPSTYIGFVTNLMFWIGLAFETPMILYFLSWVGLINTQFLIKMRKYAVLLNAVIAAAITPTTDPVNMALVMGPLTVLYEMGVLLSRLAYRQRHKGKQ